MTEKVRATALNEGDEEIERIREVRHQISAQFGHDPYRLVAYYMELQKQHSDQLLTNPEAEVAAAAHSR